MLHSGYRNPEPRRHSERRSSASTERLRQAYNGPLAREPEPRQRPTGWALKRRRAVQDGRLRSSPQWVGLACAIVMVGVVWMVRQEAPPAPLASLDTHRVQYERLAGLVRSEVGTGVESVGIESLSPEAEEIGRGLGVATVGVDAQESVILRPARDLYNRLVYISENEQVGKYVARGWRHIEGRWFSVRFR